MTKLQLFLVDKLTLFHEPSVDDPTITSSKHNHQQSIERKLHKRYLKLCGQQQRKLKIMSILYILNVISLACLLVSLMGSAAIPPAIASILPNIYQYMETITNINPQNITAIAYVFIGIEAMVSSFILI